MVKNNKLLWIVGIFIVLIVFGKGIGTQSVTNPDRDINTFSLRWIEKPSSAIKDGLVEMTINVKNTGTDFGSMLVQCSILDPKTNTWLQTQSVTPLAVNNCWPGEPFTQTKVVTLDVGEDLDVTYVVTAPHEEGTQRLYCAAYEQCYSPEEPETYTSDELMVDNIEVTKEECTETTWFMKLSKEECVGGMVVPVEEVEKEGGGISSTTALWVLGILAFIIFFFISFDEKKSKPGFSGVRRIKI